MSNALDDLVLMFTDEPNEPDTCKGVYFRYTETTYAGGGRFVFKKQISLLKRMSCPGCSKCCWVIDDAEMGMSEVGSTYFEFAPDLQHNDIVTLRIEIDSTDWETGYADDWHVEVVKATPPTLPAQNSNVEVPVLE